MARSAALNMERFRRLPVFHGACIRPQISLEFAATLKGQEEIMPGEPLTANVMKVLMTPEQFSEWERQQEARREF